MLYANGQTVSLRPRSGYLDISMKNTFTTNPHAQHNTCVDELEKAEEHHRVVHVVRQVVGCELHEHGGTQHVQRALGDGGGGHHVDGGVVDRVVAEL